METAKNTKFLPYYCTENTFNCPFSDKICCPLKWQNCRSTPVSVNCVGILYVCTHFTTIYQLVKVLEREHKSSASTYVKEEILPYH